MLTRRERTIIPCMVEVYDAYKGIEGACRRHTGMELCGIYKLTSFVRPEAPLMVLPEREVKHTREEAEPQAPIAADTQSWHSFLARDAV